MRDTFHNTTHIVISISLNLDLEYNSDSDSRKYGLNNQNLTPRHTIDAILGLNNRIGENGSKYLKNHFILIFFLFKTISKLILNQSKTNRWHAAGIILIKKKE